MTPLGKILARRVQISGPITVAEYMAECLSHPLHGYYATRDPLGAQGDFTTAPEISQMFGELVGLCLAQTWLDQGAPAPFVLAELGPGRGTLMADILRATRRVPGFQAAMGIWMVETSPTLRARQRQTLGDRAATWADSADDLPQLPLFLVANEFFDALPVRQFQRDGGGWREVLVGLADERLARGLGPRLPVPALAGRLRDTTEGQVVEVCEAAVPVMRAIEARIGGHGGVALIFDYGDRQSLGDTLQAVRAHRSVDPFESPGDADLTAQVDFGVLTGAAPALSVSALLPQGLVLERLGIRQRAEALAARLQGAALAQHEAALRRLTHADEMGTLFKTLAFVPESGALPPGYHDA